MKKDYKLWIDVSKGFLIFMVVIGHILGAVFNQNYDAEIRFTCERLYKVIYYFHMPAFFLLAGITWSAGRGGFLGYLKKKSTRLLLPYFSFGAVSLLLDYFFLHDFSLLRFLRGDACVSNSPLWFLPCMFAVQIFVYWIHKISGRDNFVKFLTLIILFVGMIFFRDIEIDILPSWICRVPFFVFLVLIGQYASEFKKYFNWLIINRRIYFVLPLCCYLMISYFLPWEAEMNDNYYLFYRVWAIIGSFSLFMLSQVINARLFVVMGTASIGILAIHKFPIVFMFEVFKYTYLSPVYIILLIILILCVSLISSIFGTLILRKFIPFVIGESFNKTLILTKEK